MKIPYLVEGYLYSFYEIIPYDGIWYEFIIRLKSVAQQDNFKMRLTTLKIHTYREHRFQSYEGNFIFK